jgi:homoserine kinase
MVLQGMRAFCKARGTAFPDGVTIISQNQIPVGSGLGSSAAAALTGLLGMAALMGQPLEFDEALALCARIEGHADNAAAALIGGLAVVSAGKEGWLARRIEIPALSAAIALPAIRLPTRAARAALPRQVLFTDATYNLGRVVMVVEALRSGDLGLLRQALDDRLHVPYRLPLIRGGQSASTAAYEAGAAAVTISGAGPSLIAFTSGDPGPVAEAMTAAFEAGGVAARGFALHASLTGARVELLEE